MQTASERVTRDRIIVMAGLAAVTALAGAYTLHLGSTIPGVETSRYGGMDLDTMQMSMPHTQAWGTGDIVLTFMMWAVMMVAMMTPSATPMMVTFAQLNRERHADQTPLPTTIIFVLGYLMVWMWFSVGATAVQWGLHSAALLSPDTMSVTPLVGGIVLILAGGYQFTPLKRVCLSRCRTPLGFLMTEWREGTTGALIMGARHGLYCIGCCWLLMTVLFAAGVMNLVWVSLVAVSVLVEKVAPAGEWVSRAIGLLTVGGGAWSLIQVWGM